MKFRFIILLVLLFSFSWTIVAADSSTEAAQRKSDEVYVLIPEEWGIYNDGTHPVETTKGINDALKWAHENGKTTFKVPAGTYLIKKQDPKLFLDTSARINMVPDMTFELDDKAVIQKETNGFTGYQTLHVGYGANNVTIKGGTYKGDKDTHDYSAKGTHEGGYGILIEGAVNVTIDGVKAVNFTGDGLCIGGKGTMIQDLYENSFVSGSIDDKGNFIADPSKIRLKAPLNFNNAIFKTEREFELSNQQKLPGTFDIFFYKQDGTYLSSLKGQKIRQIMQIPEGAVSFYLVFNQASSAGSYVEYWQRAVAKEVTVQNSEFAFNRRQGITVGGGDRVTIINNKLHDMKGAAPQSGIDVEAGFSENGHRNSNITIQNNQFYNNASYDVILYDGHDATVQGNHLASKGAIGLAVSPPFTSALIKDNHFDGTSIYAYHDVKFEGNQMNDSFTFMEGPNIQLDGMTFTNSKFGITSKQPFGVTASNITMNNVKSGELSLWGSPIRLSNIVLNGGGVTGGVKEGSVFDNLKITGATSLNLPLGTYNDCEIESLGGSINGGIFLDDPGSYQFNRCTLRVNQGVLVSNESAEVSISDSSFELLDKLYAFKAVKAKKIVFENNVLNAERLVNPTDYMVMIGDYWTRSNPSTVKEAIIRGNTLSANIEAEGISTRYAGTSNYNYTVENNVLTNAKMKLQTSDFKANNAEQ